MTELTLQNISVTVSGVALVKDASLKLSSGELVALVGPNGAGKTTLLQCALGLIAPISGAATLDDIEVGDLSPLERARRVAYLPQMRPLVWPVRVKDVVALGRYAYGASLSDLKGADADAVARAMAACDIASLAERRTDTLSGGELARVHCARAFAAEAPLLLADEPTASLDPSHQFRIMSLIRAFTEKGGGALVVVHDIALAARFADRLVWMKEGRILADGPPAETLTADRMREVFAVAATVATNSGAPDLTISGLA